MSLIRACSRQDMPAVAGLFQKTFLDRRRAAPESLSTYLAELFFGHPWYDPELASRVYVSPAGEIRGFIGVLPLRMRFRGSKIRAAVAGSLMVDEPHENPLAGARLLRSFANGPQELSITENANQLSENMWHKLGGRTVPFESLEWLCILRPAGAALALAREWFAPGALLQPVAWMIDRMAAKTGGNRFGPQPGPAGQKSDVEATDELLVEEIRRVTESYPLRPDWSDTALPWVLSHARTKAQRGAVCRRIVYDKSQTPIGCYVYYGKPRGIAWVLQVLARPESTHAVLASLLTHAFRNGSVAVRGRSHPRWMDALLHQRSVFFHRSSTVVHSSDADLLGAIHAGDGLVTGLAGEAWTRLIGDRFV